MNKTQDYLVKLLDSAIHGNKINFNIDENIQWDKLLDEARAHKVESLVYSAIDRKSLEHIDNKELLDLWKRETFLSGVNQLNHINNVSEFLAEFNKENIQVIVLKGIVIRNLYPKPELRTMCDADILVKNKDDLNRVKNVLLNLGYKESVSSDKDLCFRRGITYVEVHWSIANEKNFLNIEKFEEEIWKNSVNVKVGNASALSMCDEDLILHLCMHMAAHIKYSGFGIRQLCDFVLIVEEKGDLIDWSIFKSKLERHGIYKFIISIFEICNKLFGLKIPYELKSENLMNNKFIDLLIDEIFLSGVHGKRNKILQISNAISHANIEEKRNCIHFLKKLYFPSINAMSDKYMYAKRYKILLPIAWIHRLFIGGLNYKESISDKLKIALFGASISRRRNKLISWLEL